MVQHVEKDEYPYKDPLTGAVQNRIPAEKPKYHAKLYPAEALILQQKYATFSVQRLFNAVQGVILWDFHAKINF